MSDGDIRNGPYAARAKEYVWSTISSVFPRGITPTDIDGMVELNNCFFIFEGKTNGSKMDRGQGLCHKRLLLSMPEGRAVTVLGQHPELDRVDVGKALTGLRFCWRSGGGIQWAPPMRPCLHGVAELFVRDAQLGRLRCERWHEELEHAMRPFGEDD